MEQQLILCDVTRGAIFVFYRETNRFIILGISYLLSCDYLLILYVCLNLFLCLCSHWFMCLSFPVSVEIRESSVPFMLLSFSVSAFWKNRHRERQQQNKRQGNAWTWNQTQRKTGTWHRTHCNTLQHTATHCNTLQHTATHCNTLQHTATHCNTGNAGTWNQTQRKTGTWHRERTDTERVRDMLSLISQGTTGSWNPVFHFLWFWFCLCICDSAQMCVCVRVYMCLCKEVTALCNVYGSHHCVYMCTCVHVKSWRHFAMCTVLMTACHTDKTYFSTS